MTYSTLTFKVLLSEGRKDVSEVGEVPTERNINSSPSKEVNRGTRSALGRSGDGSGGTVVINRKEKHGALMMSVSLSFNYMPRRPPSYGMGTIL